MRFLVVQTAFIGDVILATGLLEKLHQHYPDAQIELVVRKGNEQLFHNHPFLHQVHAWDKSIRKYANLKRLIRDLRKFRYDYVINLQRFAASGLLTWRMKADKKIGFSKNPFAFAYNHKVKHQIGNDRHEIERNHDLIADLTDDQAAKPKLYPDQQAFEHTQPYTKGPFICIAPTSVWMTKQCPPENWVELVKQYKKDAPETSIYLIGSPGDRDACAEIISAAGHDKAQNLCGELNLLQSAALMSKAAMNYTNDSAPMHLASAMNAPVKAVFCSTLPAFGFGPLSDQSGIIETKLDLECRPCGLHGKDECPEGHFKCGKSIQFD